MSKLPVSETPIEDVSKEILDQAEEFRISALSKYGKRIASKIDSLSINFISPDELWEYEYERYPVGFNLLFLKGSERIFYRGQLIYETNFSTARRENMES